MTVRLADLTAGELLALYRSGAASPTEVVRDCLDRVKALDGTLNAVLTAAPDEAYADARESERRWGDGSARSLEGIPFALKDVIETARIATSYGTKVWRGHHPEADAEVVERLRTAGATVLLKVQTNELAFGAVQNPHNGPVPNPWNPSRMAGGSSSGSGAAVSARYVPCALGTDTGGSIRSPSSYCGVSGLKPTNGLLPARGISIVSTTLDSVGPMARSVEDLALAFDALCPESAGFPLPWPERPLQEASPDLRGLRVGVPAEWCFELVEPDVERITRDALTALTGLAAKVDEIVVPDIRLGWSAGWVIMVAESTGLHEGHLRHMADIDPSLRSRLLAGLLIGSSDYLQAMYVRDRIISQLDDVFRRYHVLALPTSATVAPDVNTTTMMLGGREHPRIDIATRLTILANVAGIPSLSVPCGFDSAGMPVGLQLLGPRRSEPMLLAVGRAYQEATDHHRKPPPILTGAMGSG